MNINRNKVLNFIAILASYVAIVTFVLVYVHERSLQWKQLIDHYMSFTMLRFILFIAIAATCGILLYVMRNSIVSIFKTNTVRYTLLIIAAVAGCYFKFNALEFIIFMYAVYAILFINQLLFINQSLDENKSYQSTKKIADHFLAGLFTIDSRTPALLALLLLICLPLLVIINQRAIAENMAVYCYYLLVITVILKIMEIKLGIERESYLLALLKDLWSALYGIVTDKGRLTKSIISVCSNCRQFVTINKIMYLVVLVVILALVYMAKLMYWKQ